MSKRVLRKPVALAIGAALATTIAAADVAQASAFTVSALGSGYLLAAGDEKAKEGEKPAEGKCGEGKCGEGKCGGHKKPAEEKPVEEKPKA